MVRDDAGRVHAVRASDGQHLWSTDSVAGTYDAPLVVGASVFVRDFNNRIAAFSATDGAPLWGGVASTVDKFYSSLSSDGTRIYGVSECELYAINVSDGEVAWHTPVVAASAGCSSGLYPPGTPVVRDGKVYASEPAGKMVADAATGAPLVRFAVFGYNGGTSVVVGGLWIFLNDNRVVAVDTSTGALMWTSEHTFGIGANVSATGDLILVHTGFGVEGISRLTGETVWDGGPLSGAGGSVSIGEGRLFVASQDGVRAYGPL